MRTWVLGAALLVSPGCYLSHGLDGVDAAAPGRDAGRGSDAGPRRDGGPPLPACPSDETVLEVGPEPGCASAVVPTVSDGPGPCGDEPGRTVLIRRRREGDWHLLVRSRDETSERMCYARIPADDCTGCVGMACATGGDLRTSGIGEVLPSGADAWRVFLSNQGGPIWVRVCSPPP